MTRIPGIRAALAADRSMPFLITTTAVAIAIPTLLRFILADVAPALTYSTYYPAVLICSLLCGWRYGAAAAILSGMVATYLFFEPSHSNVGFSQAISGMAIFLTSCAIIVATGDTLRRTVRELAEEKRVAQLLSGELKHRVGNMLAVVQAFAIQSAKGASPEDFTATFNGRLHALAKAHQMLGPTAQQPCDLGKLVDEACGPFCDGTNIVTTGPVCLVPPESCIPLALALHELCTNAVKHGALSRETGQVHISWYVKPETGEATIEWQEAGGPEVQPPRRRGMGSAVLQMQKGIADVSIAYRPEGVRCVLAVAGVRVPSS